MNIVHYNSLLDLDRRIKDLEGFILNLKRDVSGVGVVVCNHKNVAVNLEVGESESYIVYGYLKVDVLFNRNILVIL